MKVGIVGLGFRMSNVVNEFHKVDPEFHIAGYVDPAPAGLPNLHTFGIEPGPSFASLDDMLKNADFDLLMAVIGITFIFG